MANTRHCPQCGAELPADAPAGLCPTCLMQLGEQSHPLSGVSTGDRLAHSTAETVPIPDSGDAAETDAVPFGTRLRYFGDYEVLEEIGRGGMGVVYKARQLSLNRIVALKMIRSGELASDEEVQRFQTEAEAAANLQHPNIVAIHEIGEHQGQHYFSMDYIEGNSLAEMVREHPLSPPKAAEYVKLIAEAVQYAHDQGTLHRDLKPSNILIDQNDQLRVTDFGLAKRIEADGKLTVTGQILGTPSYVAPEQASGRRDHVGPASDVYSLGAILYELLTGRPPFQAHSPVDTILQVLESEPAQLRLLNPQAPRDLETICLKCLEKDPRRRYRSAGELAADVQRFLDGKPITARPAGSAERLWKWTRRHPTAASLVVALLVGTTLFVTFLITSNIHFQRLTARLAESLNREQHVSYGHRIALAEREWLDGRLDQAEKILSECDPELRGWEWHHLMRRCRAEVLTIDTGAYSPSAVAFSPDGTQLAVPGDGTVVIRDAETGRVLTAFPYGRARVFDLAFDAEGEHLAAAIGNSAANNKFGDVKVWNLTTGAEVFSRKFPRPARAVTLSHEGDRLAAAVGPESLSRDAQVFVWDLPTGRTLLELDNENPDLAVALHPRGHLFAVKTNTLKREPGWIHRLGSQLAIREVGTGRIVRELTGSGDLQDLRFSPDGRHLAAADFQNKVVVWETSTGRQTLTLHDAGRRVAFSSDGTQLATVDAHNIPTGTLIKVWDLNTGRQVKTIRGGFNCVAFSPDGRHVAAAGYDHTIKLWDINRQPGVIELEVEQAFGLEHVAFSPDGKIVAVADDSARFNERKETKEGVIHIRSFNEKVLSLWDAESGKKVRHILLPQKDLLIRGLAFTADGEHLVRMSSLNGNPADPPCEVSCWDVNSWKQVWSFQRPPTHRLWDLAVSPDGEKLAFGGHGESLEICRTADGSSLLTMPARALTVAFSPDGKFLATAAGTFHGELGKATLWDTQTGHQVRTFETQELAPISDLAFTPDGNLLAAATWEIRGDMNAVTLWETSTGQERGVLKGHADTVTCVRFSPDGGRLVTGSKDRTLKIWDVTTGQALLTLEGHTRDITTVAFSPNGHRIASAADDGVRIWNGTPRETSRETRSRE